ncbi:hypothetical protein [Rhodococcoides corynebacterioides]|uniref:Alkaline shock response membrane anchor protein AmaP n=1 Tax=Rhodococcoides corynebacterioides TaxID=53972 RepID=A0ABS7P4V4_9NOCA|nr:hypothetical protein [Rhodococcus corynebacterioides]MBY6367438.1 hypothetical protein [Rhodococcus corynebacterioides]MBY6407130.1 hypothetical protein [Rhodococcus corynebacterioides]
MKRSTAFFDRLGVLILGAALVALGVGAALWQQGSLPFELDSLNVGAVADRQSDSWWPWALGGAGVVLVLLLLWSLLRRLPSSAGRELTLSSDPSVPGSVTVDLRAVTKQAADVARDLPGIRSARSRLRWERSDGSRVPVITVLARTEADASLATAATDLATVRRHVAAVVGDNAVAVRVLLSS